MRSRTLGHFGPATSVLGLGCNSFGHNQYGTFLDEAQCDDIVAAAIGVGFTLFDTADVYSAGESELLLGRALRAVRQEVLIASKFGYPVAGAPPVPHGRREYVRWAIRSSLQRLGTQYVDIYTMHRPDPDTPLVETLGALQELVDDGLVRWIGSSQFTPEMLTEAHVVTRGAGRDGLVSNLAHYSLLQREPDRILLPRCRELGIALLPYWPLEGGLLTGKYRPDVAPSAGRLRGRHADVSDRTWERVATLTRFAEARGLSLIQVALGTIIDTPGVGAVIVGATTVEHVIANATAGMWRPTADDLAELDRLSAGW